MLLVACINCRPALTAGRFDLVHVAEAKLSGINALTDRTFELLLPDGRHNVDAMVMPAAALTRFSELAGHERVFAADTAALETALAELKPRARTPNIDFEWPG